MTEEVHNNDERLQNSEQQFRLLVQGVADYAIYMLDREGTVRTWNTGAQRIKGYMAEEIIGQNFSKFYTQEDRQHGEPQRSLEIAAQEGKFENQCWRVRKDGSRFWAHVLVDALHTDRGELIGFAKVTRDITESREAQLALEETRSQLVHMQKMEALGRLTGGIAHDFNNLLLAILGCLALARKKEKNPETAYLLRNAMEAAERGSSLTKRLLAFSRRQDIVPVDVCVGNLLISMQDLLRRSLGAGVHLKIDVANDVDSVRADPHQLELAILNLAINSRDAMKGRGNLAITARKVSLCPGGHVKLPPGNFICISVSDDGAGMDRETLRRASEPFFTTKELGKGTGLGLSMVYGLMEQLSGHISIQSKLGAGTSVELWIAAIDAISSASEAEAISSHDLPHGTLPLTILAVDDDPLVLMSTVAMLTDMGHRVIEALSGKKALSAFSKMQGIDLVLTDQAMPGMTGIELANALREKSPGVKIIIASGYMEAPAEGGNIEFLGKPFSQDDLSRMIRHVASC